MNSKRLYFLLVGLVALLFVGLIAGTYGVNGLLTSQATTLTGLKAKSQALAQEQLSLIKAQKDVKTYAGLEQIAKSVVPQDKNQAEAVREIANIAATYGISLASITFPASTLGNTTGGQSSTGAAVAAPVAASSAVNNLSQLQAVPTIPGVYQLTITVAGDPNKPVAYNNFVSFLSALEHNRRTAQVSTITISPNTANPNLLTFNLGLNEYIKP